MKLTIYRKLLLSILPIVCISILGIGYYSYLVAREETVKQIGIKMERQAEDMASEINRLCAQAEIDLITLSELSTIADYYNNKEYRLEHEAEMYRKEIERFLLEFSRRAKVYSGIRYLDANGLEVVKIVRNQVVVRENKSGNRLILETAKVMQKREVYHYPVEEGEKSQGRILRNAIPIFDEIGENKGVMTLELDFEMIREWVENKTIEKTGYAYLLDNRGIALAHPGQGMNQQEYMSDKKDGITGKMMKGEKGWDIYPLPGDKEYLIGYAPVKSTGWAIGVTAPNEDFLGRINDIKNNSALTIIWTIIAANLGIAIIAKRLSKPIKKLVYYTDSLAEGRFSERIEISSGDELGDLGKAFNGMAARIESSQREIEKWNRELEKRVRTTAGELKAEKEKLEGVFLSMADAVIVLDHYSRVIDLNPAAERLLGTGKGDLIGCQVLLDSRASEAMKPSVKNLQAICGPRMADKDIFKCKEFFNCQKKDCPAFESEEYRCWLFAGTLCEHAPHDSTGHASGERDCSSCPLFKQVQGKQVPVKQTDLREVKLDTPPRMIRVYRTPMFDSRNQFMGNVFVLQDVTKDRELDQMKSDFIATVSHELRTPLSSIKSFSEILLDDIDTMDRESQNKFLGIIINESDRLTRLISTILELQKIDADRMKFNMQSIQLSSIIEECVNNLSSLAQKENLKISFECGHPLPPAWGDRDKIYQVLANLISNAVKFSKGNGEIKVKAAEIGEGLLVSVTDQGMGIPADELGRVFERFFQVESAGEKPRVGTGLGLAISKELVERHGGRIWAESKLGEGSTFCFVIPKSPAGNLSAAA